MSDTLSYSNWNGLGGGTEGIGGGDPEISKSRCLGDEGGKICIWDEMAYPTTADAPFIENVCPNRLIVCIICKGRERYWFTVW